MIDLGTLGGSTSYATAISDSGQIVGYSTTSTSSSSPTHAFLLKGSGPMSSADDLGVPSGYASSYATAISSNGVYIAGYANKTVTTSDGFQETVTEPFMYTNGQWIDLGNLGGILAEATGINDSGQAVGYSTTTPNSLGGGAQEDAFLYTSSQGIQDLNTQIESGSKWTLGTATAINDNGVIAGIGGGPDGHEDGFLLYPPTDGGGGGGGGGGGSSGGGGGSNNGGSNPVGGTNPGTPLPGSSPGGPGAGLFDTKTRLKAHPRPAVSGRPVTLTATVKVLGHTRGVPTGSVRFLDGTIVLGEAALGHGKANLVISSLPMQSNPIEVQYTGGPGFAPSNSGVVIEKIKSPHSKAKVIHAPIPITSTPSSSASGAVQGPDSGLGSPAGTASALVNATFLGLIAPDKGQASHTSDRSSGTHPRRVISVKIGSSSGVGGPREPAVKQARPAALKVPTHLIGTE